MKTSVVWRLEGSAKQDEDVCMAAAGFIFLASHVPNGKNKKRFWLSPTLRGRKIYDGDELLVNLCCWIEWEILFLKRKAKVLRI